MMFLRYKSNITLAALTLSLAITPVASADQSGIAITGAFSADGQSQYFEFTLPNAVTSTEFLYFTTWSHSGGVNMPGDEIPAGGFDPFIALRQLTGPNAGYIVGLADDGTQIENNLDALLDFSTPDIEPQIALPNSLPAGGYALELYQIGNALNGASPHWAIDLAAPSLELQSAIANIGFDAETSGPDKISLLGDNAKWNIANSLNVGLQAPGTLNIYDQAVVTVADTTTLGPFGSINMLNGRFNFGVTTLPEFSRINAFGGSMSGIIVNNNSLVDASSLTALQNLAVDLTDVTFYNEGALVGPAFLGPALYNAETGHVEVITSERLRFAGEASSNIGQINLLGGAIQFGGTFFNQAAGLVIGNGSLSATATINEGAIALSGTTNITGNLLNTPTGQIIVSGGGPTTFFDDVINNGSIRVSQNSFVVFFGDYSGANGVGGPGTVLMEGDLKPGNSPAAQSFGGNLVLAPQITTTLELYGTQPGFDYDQLLVANTLTLDGTLNISVPQTFTPTPYNNFTIATFDTLVGDFATIENQQLANDLLLIPEITANAYNLTAAIQGDFNFDGQVNIADLIIWAQGFGGTSTTFQTGDANLDSAVNIADLIVWAQHFGQTESDYPASVIAPPSGGLSSIAFATAIPEPSSFMLLALTAVPLLRRKMRRG